MVPFDRLSLDEAWGLVYAAYAHLADLQTAPGSRTRDLMNRLRQGDAGALLVCMGKLLEEQDEVRLVLAGRHLHAGASPRAALESEVRQALYWAMLPSVGRGILAESIGLGTFLRAGVEGREPEKSAYGEGAVAVLRRALVSAGRALAIFNATCPDEPIAPRDLAVAELREMAGRPHLKDFFEKRASLT